MAAAVAHMAAVSSLAGVRSRYREVRVVPVGRAAPVGQEVLADREGLGAPAVLADRADRAAPVAPEGREALADREGRANREAREDHTRSRPHR